MKKFKEEKEITNSKETKSVPPMPVPKPLFGGISSFFGPAKPMSVPARKVESKPADSPVSKPADSPVSKPAEVKSVEPKAPIKVPSKSKTAETSKPVSRSESKYPVYKKDSAEARDFRANFAKARKEKGKDGTFEFQGRKYNTKIKGK